MEPTEHSDEKLTNALQFLFAGKVVTTGAIATGLACAAAAFLTL